MNNIPPDAPAWIQTARDKWEFRGQKRPAFAVEPKEGQTSVWDFPRPPAIQCVEETVSVLHESLRLAESRNTLAVCETANPPCYYIPPDDVFSDNFIALDAMSSWCEWKGEAHYWALPSDPQLPVAWTYPKPFKEYQQLAGYYAFYPQNLSCYVGSEKVKAQSSQFYAGWITQNLVGPFKGDPGTEDW